MILNKLTPDEKSLVQSKFAEYKGLDKVAEWVAFIVDADPLDIEEWKRIKGRVRKYLKKKYPKLFRKGN